MSRPNDKKLSDLLSELKAEYLIKLPEKILALRQFTEQQSWQNVEAEFHKLKGTGRTYGYPDISVLCERLEFLAQHKDTQLPVLFHQAIDLLTRMLKAYEKGEPYNLSADATMKTILKMGGK